MKKLQRVGFVIDVDDAWLGGINYYRNLITAIYDDPQRGFDVVLIVGTKVNPEQLKGFPDVEIVRTKVIDRTGLLRRVRRRLLRILGRDLLLQRVLSRHNIDVLSHYGDVVGRNGRTSVMAWIPDFQHLHLPKHFTDHERAERNAIFKRLADNSDLVILSSESARADLVGLYPEAQSRSEVLRFVPHVDVQQRLPDLAELKMRHGFTAPYIYLPNQYWAHKNHRVVIEALGLLKQQGCSVTVVSTGSPSDYRNPDHYPALERRIAELGVGDRYIRLGVVPYSDLLALMKESICLINPSLFEGWSTTVEEARAMDKFILLSDIPVHREQTPQKSAFFGSDDAATLAELMYDQWQAHAADTTVSRAWSGLSSGHGTRRNDFARRYSAIVDRVLAEAR